PLLYTYTLSLHDALPICANKDKKVSSAVQDMVDDALTKEVAAGADLALLRSLIHKHTQRLDRYACKECGFEARTYYWQCPGCNHWESYPPLLLEEHP